MLVLTLFVLVAGGVAVWMFKPAFFTGKKKPARHGLHERDDRRPAARRAARLRSS